MAIVLEMIPDSVTDVMVQRVQEKDTFLTVKSALLRYVEQREDFDGAKPMDIGNVGVKDYEENEDEQETDELYALGRGYQKGKGKGFNGMCNHCGTWGHKALDCPQRRGCWTCGGMDHRSAECPKGKGKKGGGPAPQGAYPQYSKGGWQPKGFGKDHGKGFGKDYGGKGNYQPNYQPNYQTNW